MSHHSDKKTAATIDSFTFSEENQTDPLLSIFNRYRPSLSKNESRERITLVFHHCLALRKCLEPKTRLVWGNDGSLDKETWQPTIEHLFDIQNTQKDSKFVVSEVWAMDASNHGQTAALNDRQFTQPDLASYFCTSSYRFRHQLSTNGIKSWTSLCAPRTTILTPGAHQDEESYCNRPFSR